MHGVGWGADKLEVKIVFLCYCFFKYSVTEQGSVGRMGDGAGGTGER